METLTPQESLAYFISQDRDRESERKELERRVNILSKKADDILEQFGEIETIDRPIPKGLLNDNGVNSVMDSFRKTPEISMSVPDEMGDEEVKIYLQEDREFQRYKFDRNGTALCIRTGYSIWVNVPSDSHGYPICRILIGGNLGIGMDNSPARLDDTIRVNKILDYINDKLSSGHANSATT